MVSTYVQGIGSGALAADNTVSVFASTLRAVSTSTVSSGVRLEPTDAALSRPRLNIVDSIVSAPAGRGFLLGPAVVDGLNAVGVTVDAATPYSRDGVTLDDAALNTCDELDTDPGCGELLDGVVQREVPFVALSLDDDGLLPSDAGRLDDSAAEAAQSLAVLVAGGAPSTLIGDVRGACRPELGSTRGAYEMRATSGSP